MEGLKGPEQAQQILAKYPVAQLNHTLLSFVANARAAMGPNMLKVKIKRLKFCNLDLPVRGSNSSCFQDAGTSMTFASA